MEKITMKQYLVAKDGFIDLGQGGLLQRLYGKYEPNLCIVVDNHLIEGFFKRTESYSTDAWRISGNSADLTKHNIQYSGNVRYTAYGTYRKNAKGTDIFQLLPESQAKHKLICVDWGGSFSRTRGIERPNEFIYYRVASSNGGGTGYDYLIIPKDYYQAVSLDDI
jgi:hypothetical protein